MPFLDFLFEGKPPPIQTTSSKSESNLPEWYNTYMQALLAKANTVAAEPYNPYMGPTVAPLTADQQAAAQGVRGAQGAALPALGQARSVLTSATGIDPSAAAAPYLGAAGATNIPGAAAPYMAAAGRTFPGAAAEYMSPYTTGVVNRIAELGNRNLTESLLPSIQDKFIAAGQVGSRRNAEFGSRAVRDTANEIAGQQAAALEAGYGQAGQMFGADASRAAGLASAAAQQAQSQGALQASLAGTAGNLANTRAGILTQGAGALSDLGTAEQTARMRDAAALGGVGATEQSNIQANLDAAKAAFGEERAYPAAQTQYIKSLLAGTADGTGTKETVTSAPSGSSSPSSASQLASLAILARMFKAKGGAVRSTPTTRRVMGALHRGG